MPAAMVEVNNPFVQAISGGIGAAASTFLCYPLQRRVVREQADLRGSWNVNDGYVCLGNGSGEKRRRCNENRNHRRFRHQEWQFIYPSINRMTRMLLRMLKSGAFVRVYYGALPKCFSDIIFNFIYFYAYSLIQNIAKRRIFTKHGYKNYFSVSVSLLAASLAGAVTVLLTQPMDNIVTRIQVGYSEGIVHYRCRQRRNYYNMPAHSMVMELSNKRVLNLWRGLVPSLALILNPAINYTTFGLVKAMYLSHQRHNGGEQQLNTMSAFILGVISKIIATTATYPLICAKVLLMVSGTDVKGLPSCLRLITKERGYTGLYAGYSAQLLHVVLKSGILLALKEEIASIVLTQSAGTKSCE